MKLLHIACLAGLLWLSGCATQNGAPGTPPGTDGSVPTTPAPSTEVTHTPQFPSGPLLPIAPARASRLEVMPLFTPSDLWDRIRRGFAMPDLQHELVQDREQWYANRPDYMQRMTERSRKYLFHIVEELERRNMPTELALLPYIESAFNPQAVSSAKAAGMWQFMPATGNYFDLKQNAFRDDRRDVLASTRAALDYLQKLHGMFGDWHLALAAYNWGEGSVGRAIARNQKAGLGTSYTDLTMPAETRLYVPKLQAVKNIVANPEAFRTDLPLIENHPYFQTVDITRDIDVALAARLADVELADFKALNPSLDKPVILAAGTPQILLPWDNAKVFERNLAAYKEGQHASWTVWSVPSTMSTAEVARRVGMDESELRSINRIPPRMLVKAGSALIVPRSASTRADVAEHVADK
ncbi:MAG: transglycosylase SLT domain-containing protein, partial [Giesbergeria sp.]